MRSVLSRYLFLLSFDFVTSNQITGEFIARPWSGFCVLCAVQWHYGTLYNKRFYNHRRSTNERLSVIHSTSTMHLLSCILGLTKKEIVFGNVFPLPFPSLLYICTEKSPVGRVYKTQRADGA